MSLFTDLVVKLERRKLRTRDGAMPLIEISRHHERELFKRYAILTGIFALAILAMCFEPRPCGAGCDPNNLYDAISMRFRTSFNTLLLLIMASFALTYVYFLVAVTNKSLTQAVEDRIKSREEKAAKIAAEEARKAAEAAERSRQQALVVAEQGKRQQVLFDFRVQALKQMENGLKELLFDRRERAEWVPESADEEHLYEMIRKRFREAGKDVPELGLLRRSSDPLIIMILGDRSFLPKEPTDELLSRRQLPPVTRLLS